MQIPTTRRDRCDGRYREMQERRRLTTEHPIVRIHPETKEKVLVSPNFLKEIVGLTARK